MFCDTSECAAWFAEPSPEWSLTPGLCGPSNINLQIVAGKHCLIHLYDSSRYKRFHALGYVLQRLLPQAGLQFWLLSLPGVWWWWDSTHMLQYMVFIDVPLYQLAKILYLVVYPRYLLVPFCLSTISSSFQVFKNKTSTPFIVPSEKVSTFSAVKLLARALLSEQFLMLQLCPPEKLSWTWQGKCM